MINDLNYDLKNFGLKRSYILKVMNFQFFSDFLEFFENFEFEKMGFKALWHG